MKVIGSRSRSQDWKRSTTGIHTTDASVSAFAHVNNSITSRLGLSHLDPYAVHTRGGCL